MPKSKIQKSTSTDCNNRWLLIAPKKDGVTDDHFVSLPNPKTGNSQQYLLGKKEIFEVIKFSEQPRSWFINNQVQQDGSLFVVTKCDPLFLVLPFLRKSASKYMTLDHILEDADYQHINKLTNCVSYENLSNLCDIKGDDLKVCKLDEVKVIDWLKTKVELTKVRLEVLKINASGAQSSTFVRSRKSRDSTSDDYLRYAFGLVSDYISDYWSHKVKESLVIQDELLESSGEEPVTKKPKLDDSVSGQPNEDYSKYFAKSKKSDQNSNTKLTAAQKSLAKVNTKGMKSISTFFGAKTTKSGKSK